MNINRYNYEEFFILYMDNELDADGRRDVEAFVQENPDLKAELDILMQSKLSPDADISFVDKGSLLRFDNASISLANYEEWLTSYIDNELTEEERKNVEEFVAINPAAQKELSLLQQTKLQPEAIVFPYKESLYRRTEKARVISIRWVRIAAAAVLLFAISTTAVVLLLNSNKSHDTNSTAGLKPKEQPGNNGTVKQPANTATSKELAATPAEKKKDEPNKETSNAIAVKQSNKTDEKKEQNEAEDKKLQIAHTPGPIIEDKSTNNLPDPIHNPNVNGNNTGTVSADVLVTGSEPSSLTKSSENSGKPDVTTSPDNSYNKETGAVKQDDPDAQYAKGNGGLRGFFRKVTRTIEKRTNIKATDDDDRLLIAGLAIKMN